jgi:tRNA 2-(methylsulfanyl)-N6-isopentenyladenosine37 hydroxylase
MPARHRTPFAPALTRTPEAWAATASSDIPALLSDHAWLERKAAANALDLLGRWPAPSAAGRWVRTLTGIARDETRHLQAVCRLLAARGGTLPRSHRNAYASALHALVRRGQGPLELLDRLLVSALIEARSCERFERLAAHAEDAALAAFYRGLIASEAGHYLAFLALAEDVLDGAQCRARWIELVAAETRIVAADRAGPRVLSGIAVGVT